MGRIGIEGVEGFEASANPHQVMGGATDAEVVLIA
jgi:hypothetical protein